MTLPTLTPVRLLVEVLADDGSVLPIGTRGTVIGYAGDKLVVEFHDQETDTRTSAEVERWDVLAK